jgi:hypothetical protein
METNWLVISYFFFHHNANFDHPDVTFLSYWVAYKVATHTPQNPKHIPLSPRPKVVGYEL